MKNSFVRGFSSGPMSDAQHTPVQPSSGTGDFFRSSSFPGCGSGRGSDCFGADAILPVRNDEPHKSHHDHQLDRQMEAMEDRLESRIAIPGRSQLHTEICQGVAPWPRTDEGVDVEASLVHLCYAC